MLFILLSGKIASGKTSLGSAICKKYGYRLVKTSTLIDAQGERVAKQVAGEGLDEATDGTWIRDGVRHLLRDDDAGSVVLDCVRTEAQARHIREAFGHNRVFHIHLIADEGLRRQRFEERRAHHEIKEDVGFRVAQSNRTESQVDDLVKVADVIIDTSRCETEDSLVRVECRIGLKHRGISRLVDVMVGGQYGSEGKGHVASFLSREYQALVRVGGPNAGHTVIQGNEKSKFHHLPSGTIHNDEAKLIIGPGAVVHPESLMQEIQRYKVDCNRLSIDPSVMIITKPDKDKEASMVKSIGSTGQGVGAATARRIMGRGGGLPGLEAVRLAGEIKELSPYVRPTHEQLSELFRNNGRVFLEGTQGTGLSLFHGSYPHVTSRDTTVSGCLAEAGISPSRVRKVVMVCRTYPIRVQNGEKGTSGYMKKELDWEDVACRSGIPLADILTTEKTTTTNKERRVGEFDWSMLRLYSELNAPTDIALTFTDYLSVNNRQAYRFDQLETDTQRFIQEVETVSGAPVSLITVAFNDRGIIDRRRW